MLVSIVILIYNRPRLTRQTLDTLSSTIVKTDIPYEVIIVDNASLPETQAIIDEYTDMELVRIEENQGIGYGKNRGVEASRGTHLYISDNDMYFLDGWLDALVHTHETYHEAKIIGAFRHPYHGIYETIDRGGVIFQHSDQQVGSSWFLTKTTWNTYGPLLEDVGYGEDDVFMCNKINSDGFWVGSMYPHRLIHCGKTNSDNQDSPGSHQLENPAELTLDALPPDILLL